MVQLPDRSSWSFIHFAAAVPVGAYLIAAFCVLMLIAVTWSLCRAAALGDRQMEKFPFGGYTIESSEPRGFLDWDEPPITFAPYNPAPPAGRAGVRARGRSAQGTDSGARS